MLAAVAVLAAGCASAPEQQGALVRLPAPIPGTTLAITVQEVSLERIWTIFAGTPIAREITPGRNELLVVVRFEVRDVRTGETDSRRVFDDFGLEEESGRSHSSPMTHTNIREVPFVVPAGSPIVSFRAGDRAVRIASLITNAPTGDFRELGTCLAADTRIRVTSGDVRTKGHLVDISERELTLRKGRDLVRLPCEAIDRVEVLRDSVATGAVIGGLIAALPAWNGCQNKGSNIPCVVLSIGAYSGLGALLDKANGPPTRDVYIAPPTTERCRARPGASPPAARPPAADAAPSRPGIPSGMRR